MANNVTQQLTVRGPNVADIVASIAGDGQPFDFNRIIPLPDELRIEESSKGEMGVAVITGHVYEYLDVSWVKQRGIATPEAFMAYIRAEQPDTVQLGQRYLDNEQKFGFRSWFDWCDHNWGTKWNAYNVTEPEFTDEQTVLTYEAAWTAAIPVIKRLSERFPDTEFSLKHFDRGWTHAGIAHCLSGQCFDDCFEPHPNDAESLSLYREIFGVEGTIGRSSSQRPTRQIAIQPGFLKRCGLWWRNAA